MVFCVYSRAVRSGIFIHMRKSIGLKIFSVALVIVVLMAIASGISSWHLNTVSGETIELAEYYVPLQRQAHLAARHASAELVHLERYLSLKRAGAPAARLKLERAKLEGRAADTEKAVAEALALVERGLNHPGINIVSTNFLQLRSELPQISRAHMEMSETVRRYLNEVDRGDERLVVVYEESLARQRSKVSDEIADVTTLLDRLTADSADSAAAAEAQAKWLIWSVTAFSALVGLLLAGLITRALVRPLRELVSGTRRVQEGDLKESLTVSSNDEIGTLTESFNHMIAGLRQKEVIQNTFGKYVDPRIVKNLLENDTFAHEGEKRRMTVYFSDLQGFTSLCEQWPPERVVQFLNRYFSLMAGPIRAEHGIIDKYIGDSIMAFWGPPFVEEALHPLAACRAAVAQMHLLAQFNAELAETQGAGADGLIKMRIGICTGEVTVGNVGSENSKGYTVIGDTVNLAARLESAGKQYGTSIIISEETWLSAREGLDARELDKIRVVGKNEPVRIFEVIGLNGEANGPARELTGLFEQAIKDFRQGSIGVAKGRFEDCLRLRANDRPSRLFLERIELLERAGLPDSWDGVWTLKEK